MLADEGKLKTQEFSMKNTQLVSHQCSEGPPMICEQSLENFCEHENY